MIDGKAVRLFKGDYNQKTVYNDSPLSVAKGFEELGASYDYIFVDTPPVTVVTEAAAMAKAANGVILVVRQNNTIHESIERALANLKMTNAKLLGFILNGASEGGYGYGRYNSSYRRYGGYGGSSQNSYSYSYGDKAKKKTESKK